MNKKLIVISCFAAGLALSWALSIGIIKFITHCFGVDISVGMATLLWIIACVVFWPFRNILPSGKKGE